MIHWEVITNVIVNEKVRDGRTILYNLNYIYGEGVNAVSLKCPKLGKL